MSFRKALKYFLPWIALCAIFWKPLLESGIGFFAKSFLQVSRGWRFDYRLVEIGERGIVFTDPVLREAGHFQLKADEVVVSIWEKHFEVENPRIVLSELPSWKGKSSPWTYVIRNGVVEGKGIAPLQFEAERNFPSQLGRFQLHWEGGASLAVEVLEESDFLKVDIACEEFNPMLLQKWFGKDIEGKVNGRAYLVTEGEKITRGMLQLRGKEIRWRDRALGIEGTLDWDGPFEWESFWQAGRLRVAVTEGEFFSLGERVEKIRGECSFVGGMGTKWEVTGDGGFPISWKGRGFFQSLKEHWVESELSCNDAFFSLTGRKQGEWKWEGICREVQAEHATLVQSFLAFADPLFNEWKFFEGCFDLEGKAVGPIGQLQQWELCALSIQNLKGKGKSGSFSLEKGLYTPSGEFSFENGAVFDSTWNGRGKIEDGAICASNFSGKWRDFFLTAQAIGSLEMFSAQMKGEGPLIGEMALEGGWDGKQFFFKVEEGKVEDFSFAGCGSIDPNFDFIAQVSRFAGPVSTLWKLSGKESRFEGFIESTGNGFLAQGGKEDWDWSLQAKIDEGSYSLFPHVQLDRIQMEVGADSDGFTCYEVKGDLLCGREFPFYCPVVKSHGEFDIRFLGEMWDLLRFTGRSTGEEIQIDREKSHILGRPFEVATVAVGLETFTLQFDLPWKSLIAALSYPRHWTAVPLEGAMQVALDYNREGGSQLEVKGENLFWKKDPLLFDFHAFENGETWKIDRCQIADFSLLGEMSVEETLIRLVHGQGKWGEKLDFDCEGKIDLSRHMEVRIPHVKVDLSLASFFAEKLGIGPQEIEGILEGTGHLVWNDKWEADFDLTASPLQTSNWIVENQGPLHVSYSSDKGVFFGGMELRIQPPEADLPPVHCKIDLLQYDIGQSFWILNRSHLHLPQGFLANFPPLLQNFPLTHDVDLVADLSCNSDFSRVECSISEGFLPFDGTLRHVQDVYFLLDENHCGGNFSYVHQGHPLTLSFKVDTSSPLSGRLIFEDGEKPLQEGEIPLTVDWSSDEEGELRLHSIEGTFGGLEALFHAEEQNSLIGSARIDFSEFSHWIPPSIAEVFHDLKMGKGYEVKGHFRIAPKGIYFQGLLSGKQLELFGYQLRTLLGQIDLSPEKVRIYDVKVSDSAGILKIDEILAEGAEERPWTISMPRLTITELRPSLLQKVGGKPGEISPLVVRELKINDFKGLLEDSNTYTAWGELFFINSYKREYTVFDVPSDVLSRIVGLDFELLTPVRGSIKYELKNRHFRLTELKDSYSEGNRSEFFLVEEGAFPSVDLDGNIQIFVKMKQFVLFKFTESFLISIEGKLDDPKFHLQKKRHFLGL